MKMANTRRNIKESASSKRIPSTRHTGIVTRARKLHRPTHPLTAHRSSYMAQIYELAVKNDNFEVKAKVTL
jgi:hypothetical protein